MGRIFCALTFDYSDTSAVGARSIHVHRIGIHNPPSVRKRD